MSRQGFCLEICFELNHWPKHLVNVHYTPLSYNHYDQDWAMGRSYMVQPMICQRYTNMNGYDLDHWPRTLGLRSLDTFYLMAFCSRESTSQIGQREQKICSVQTMLDGLNDGRTDLSLKDTRRAGIINIKGLYTHTL